MRTFGFFTTIRHSHSTKRTLDSVLVVQEIVQGGDCRNDSVLVRRGELLHDLPHVGLVAKNPIRYGRVYVSHYDSVHTANAVANAANRKFLHLLVFLLQSIQKEIDLFFHFTAQTQAIFNSWIME